MVGRGQPVVGNSTIFQVLVAQGVAIQLIDFFLGGQLYFREGHQATLQARSAEIVELVASVQGKLDESLASSFTGEYLGARQAITDINDMVCESDIELLAETRSCPIWEGKWPFLARIHRWTGMDGVRAAEGGEGVTGAMIRGLEFG